MRHGSEKLDRCVVLVKSANKAEWLTYAQAGARFGLSAAVEQLEP